MAKKVKTTEPRKLICSVTGLEIPYSGKGRPPKYHPSIKVEHEKKLRKERYEARKLAKAAKLMKTAAAPKGVTASAA